MDYTPYTSEFDQHAASPVAQNSSKRTTLLMIGGLIVAILLGTGIVYWVAQKFPDKMRDILISVDRFGITSVGAAEQQRVRAINRLPGITYEERQVLVQRTVFLGASREMVYLALGEPVCVLQSRATAQQPAAEAWVYYIEGDRKPTQLMFQNNELVNAGKTSALDTCK